MALSYPNTKNVPRFIFGKGSIAQLPDLLSSRRGKDGFVAFFLDIYFEGSELKESLPTLNQDLVFMVDSSVEPTIEDADSFTALVKAVGMPDAVVGIGGGCTLDIAKAVSNLLTNDGKAEDYQGWNLVRNPGVYKIGIPTISGTGAEASRTCVLTNHAKNLKLGMNSDFTIFDQLILDPALSKTVPRDQYFFTGMDTYIHCFESLQGQFRHPVADAFSRQALELCREVFLSDDMMSDENREKLMVASYLGGCAIANTFVGVVHPVSAGLSIVLGTHHCIGNCAAFDVLEEFYPEFHREFQEFKKRQGIRMKHGLTGHLGDEGFERLYKSTIIHEKPLMNALGPGFQEILTPQKVRSIFSKI